MTRAHGWTRVVGIGCLVLALGCGKTWKKFAYEGFDRDGWQHPEQVIEALHIRPGEQIADLGAGSGYFTFDLAQATGPTGTVYAVDIDPDMISLLEDLVQENGTTNVRTILATPDDAGLPEGEIDLLFTSNTYHHLDNPTAYFARIRRSLSPDGRVAILDLRPEAGWFQRWFGHATPPGRIRTDMSAAGYDVVDQEDFVQRQSFVVFAPRR